MIHGSCRSKSSSGEELELIKIILPIKNQVLELQGQEPTWELVFTKVKSTFLEDMEVLAIKELHTMIYIVSTWKLKHGPRSTWRMPHQKEEEDTVFSLMKINFMFMEDGTQRCNTIIFAFLILKKMNGPILTFSMKFRDGTTHRFSLKLFQLGNFSYLEESKLNIKRELQELSANMLTLAATWTLVF
jgi:hypothetical protein